MSSRVLQGLGELERKLGRNDEARAAYTEARTLYREVGNHLGEANVLQGLGNLERKLGRNDEANRNFHQAAYVYSALGMEDYKDLARELAEASGGQDN